MLIFEYDKFGYFTSSYEHVAGAPVPLYSTPVEPTFVEGFTPNWHHTEWVNVANGDIVIPEEVPAAPPVVTIVSKLEFLNIFTMEELAGIYTVAKTDVLVEILLDKLKASEFIDKSDPQIEAGIDLLIAKDLLMAGRKSMFVVSNTPVI